MLVRHDQYIFPPRSKDAIPRADTEIFGMLGWTAQLKYNDSHALIKYCANGNIELWNRHAERFRTYHAPSELIEELRTIGERLKVEPGKVTILDGGLLDQKHPLVKDTIALWDILVLNGEHLLGTTYGERYNQLRKLTDDPWFHEVPTIGPVEFGLKLTKSVFIPESYTHEHWNELWDLVHKVNAPFTTDDKISSVLEGLFFKDTMGILEMGFRENNNDSWNMRSRITTGRHRF